ncbi:MAG: capsule assembly Wzi family protein [Bacteroidota bacterium]
MKRLLILTVVLLWFLTPGVYGQVSIVPSIHPVYDWLHQQRIEGRLYEFEYEDLPVTRGKVVRFLKEIQTVEGELSYADQFTLDAYLKEFDPDYLKERNEYGFFTTERPLIERIKYFLEPYNERQWVSIDDSSVGINGAFDIQLGQATLSGENGSDTYSSYINYRGIRGYATFQDIVGLHLEAQNVSGNGDLFALEQDDFWGPSETVERQRKNTANYYEAFLTVKKGIASFDIGRGSLRIGPGVNSSILLSETAPNFNWLRLKFHSKRIRYTALHGSLYARPNDTFVIVGQDTARTRIAPERWIVMHRLSLKPIKQVQIAVTEMLTYSNRVADLSYLNPVAPIFISELENSDRDNAFLALDVVAQPIPKVEVFATLLIDDLISFSDILQDEATRDDDVALNVGFLTALPFSSQFAFGYTRLEPFVYTHWQRLNTFEQRGRSLGHYLGPNADELEFRFTKWLPYRAWIQFAYRNVRKGFNPVDENGNLVRNVGGDLLIGSNNAGFIMFQDADLSAWHELEFGGQIEPFRGVVLSANIVERNVFNGTRADNFRLIDLRFQLGF